MKKTVKTDLPVYKLTEAALQAMDVYVKAVNTMFIPLFKDLFQITTENLQLAVEEGKDVLLLSLRSGTEDALIKHGPLITKKEITVEEYFNKDLDLQELGTAIQILRIIEAIFSRAGLKKPLHNLIEIVGKQAIIKEEAKSIIKEALAESSSFLIFIQLMIKKTAF